MQIYLVGGAVRDQLLGRPVEEKDYVVVGGTPEEMLALGFRPVGKEFPVFIDPKTGFEYALARTEKKVGRGYKGFKFYASPEVTLEKDLQRRDLTINAMAQTEDGKIIDPYNGQQDLKNKILRHVSPAFAEDPVRILRVARFAARYCGFQVDAKTMQLMEDMVKAGEVNVLVPERVWQEFEKALQEECSERFLRVLKNCGALSILFPELANVYEEAERALQQAEFFNYGPDVRFAAMFFAVAPEAVKSFCERLRVPTEFYDLALLVAKYYQDYIKANSATPEQLLNLLEKTDAFRRPQRFEKFLCACDVGCDKQYKKIYAKLHKAFQAAAGVSNETVLAKGLAGKAIAGELRRLRIDAIASVFS